MHVIKLRELFGLFIYINRLVVKYFYKYIYSMLKYLSTNYSCSFSKAYPSFI